MSHYRRLKIEGGLYFFTVVTYQRHEFLTTENSEIINIEVADALLFIEKLKKEIKYKEAAGGLVVNNNNELLMIHRIGYDDLPKGHIEKGEDTQTTAIREVQEECGITPYEIVKELHSSYHVFMMKEKWILKKVFWFLMLYKGTQIPVPQQEENITEANWNTKADVKRKYHTSFHSLRKHLDYFLKKM